MTARRLTSYTLVAVFAAAGGAAGLYWAQYAGLGPLQPPDRGADRESADAHPGHDDGHDDHDDHNDHDGHEHDGEGPDHGNEIVLSPELMAEAGIEVGQAQGGRIARDLLLPGEIALNADRLAHIVPRVDGLVREVRKTLGDEVRAGEVMAILESRELAGAKAEFLAAEQRLSLAQANMQINDELKGKGIVPELDYLAARREVEEAQINLQAADVRLHTFGLTHDELGSIAAEQEEALLVYELRAPFSGTVIEKHITLGELVSTQSDVFVVADLSDVWATLTVYQKDLDHVQTGQEVTVLREDGSSAGSATIDYVSAVVDEATRTALARVTLANAERRLRPGLFVTARVRTDVIEVPVLVPLSAIQTMDDQACVFVEGHEGFAPRSVTLGRSDGQNVEIREGLHTGERFVSEGAFRLKAELAKGSFSAHGHAH
jgi:cobalt-zinc-cadmium efflux system membrane fusion protein